MIEYDWNTISQSKKENISKDKPIFIWGSRWISGERISQIKKLSQQRKVLWGIIKEDWIEGLDNSLQFDTMKKQDLLDEITDEDNIDLIEYFQRDLKHIIKEIKFASCILINGSWHKAIHYRAEFWEMMHNGIQYKLISPFSSEAEAIEYAEEIEKDYQKHKLFDKSKEYEDSAIFKVVKEESTRSFDWNYQIAAALVKDKRILLTAHNTVVPFETYSAHYGSLREKNFAEMGSLEHYDTVHAEMELLVRAAKEGIDLNGTSLYINVLPCPTCAMNLSRSGIQEIVYSQDHSEGFAIKILEKSGKKVRRFIP